MNRRRFLQATVGAAMLLGGRQRAFAAFAKSLYLTKFHPASPLRRFGVEIPVLSPLGTYGAEMDYYEVTVGCYRDKLHPELPGDGPRLYGYKATKDGLYRHLGGAVLAKKGRPVRLRLKNELPPTHILPFDPTIPMPESKRQDRAAIHLHGGLVPWTSDGGPFHWISNPANNSGTPVVGSSVVNWLPDRSGIATDDYYYPNNQTARFMWYHDHAIGITRLNAYAGAATGYIIYDDPPNDLLVENILTGWDIPLVVQDHSFWDDTKDPGYSEVVTDATAGDLWYPRSYDTAIFGPAPKAPEISAVPEFWADTMLVNGTCYPWHPVSRNRYRIRILNACGARFLRLAFVQENGTTGEPAGGYNRPAIAPVGVWQIGTEGGFLPYPTELAKATGVPVAPLVLGPAERADLIVDFSGCTGNVLLYNDAPAPFPAGSPIFDDFPGNNQNPAPLVSGKGPNTRTLMRFVVQASTGSSPIPDAKLYKKNATPPLQLAYNLNLLPTQPDLVNGGLMVAAGIRVAQERHLTLNEAVDNYDRLMQLIGTNIPTGPGAFGREYLSEATENLSYGSYEIWNVYNLTADTHPMHFHLFNVKVLRRRPFRVKQFTGVVPPLWSALGRGPEVNETGWKETVQMHPGECTTVALFVENPLSTRTVQVAGNNGDIYKGTLPWSPRFTDKTVDEYVWHCHILEHEEHDMMRPLLAS